MENTHTQFKKDGYIIARDLYPVTSHTPRIPDLFSYTKRLPPSNMIDERSPGCPSYYNETEISKVHIRLLPILESLLNIRLYPTYCYMRVYNKTSTLKPHKDRPACEISVTLTIGNEGGQLWPIHVMDLHGTDHEVELKPGDGLVYRGCDLTHWRNELQNEIQTQSQAFFHYVEQDEPNEDHIYDLPMQHKR